MGQHLIILFKEDLINTHILVLNDDALKKTWNHIAFFFTLLVQTQSEEKIKPFFKKLIKSLQILVKDISIDVKVVSFKRRWGYLQFIAIKPLKYCIKTFGLTRLDTYIYNIFIDSETAYHQRLDLNCAHATKVSFQKNFKPLGKRHHICWPILYFSAPPQNLTAKHFL